MKAVNAEFDHLRKHNYNIHESGSGATYTDESQATPDDVTNRFTEIVEQLIKMAGVNIEVCGSFIWCSGNTSANKDELNAMGFRWASKTKMWFPAPRGWMKRGREWSMDRIREVHGPQRVRRDDDEARKGMAA